MNLHGCDGGVTNSREAFGWVKEKSRSRFCTLPNNFKPFEIQWLILEPSGTRKRKAGAMVATAMRAHQAGTRIIQETDRLAGGSMKADPAAWPLCTLSCRLH